MSFPTTRWALQQSPATTHEKMLLTVLADCQNEISKRCDPSIGFLARACLMSERNAIRVVQSLADQGFITMRKTVGRSTSYAFNMPSDQCHCDTSDTQSPPTHSHPTPDTQSPHP